jgi:hypothetical protein
MAAVRHESKHDTDHAGLLVVVNILFETFKSISGHDTHADHHAEALVGANACDKWTVRSKKISNTW